MNCPEWAPYANLPYRFLLGFTGQELDSAAEGDANRVVLTAAPAPASAVDLRSVRWQYDESLLDGQVDPAAGTLTLSAKPNRTGDIVETPVTCTLPSGIPAGLTLRIRPVPAAPAEGGDEA